jgi:hypothetical protein
MPRRLGRHLVLAGGDDESVRMYLRIMMMMRPAIMVRIVEWVIDLAPGMAQRGGIRIRAEFMRPQVQQSRQGHDDSGDPPTTPHVHTPATPPKR